MFDSIRTRLTLWYVGILAAFLLVFALVVYYAAIKSFDRELSVRLQEMAASFETAALSEERERNQESLADNGRDAVKEAAEEMRLKDFPFTVYSADGEVITTTADFDYPFDGADSKQSFEDLTISSKSVRVYRTDLSLSKTRFYLFVFHSLEEKEELQRQLGETLLILVPLTLLLAGLVGSLMARKALAPVADLGRQTEKITANNLGERLVIKNEHDELGKLAIVMNDLLERLDASFEQQKRFMADASHELRTPLAIVRGESEVVLSKQDRSPDEYRESLAIVHDESERLTKIVEDLFTLARADAGQFQAHLSPVYLNDIVADSVRSISVLARAKDIQIETSANGEMSMDADEALLRRLFVNLLDNAVKYNRAGGRIAIRSESSNGHYILKISDTGQGIPAAEQQYIFDRFYRVDKARSRGLETETTGAGLGLAISQWIAELHGGHIKLVSSDENGSVFSITFPR